MLLLLVYCYGVDSALLTELSLHAAARPESLLVPQLHAVVMAMFASIIAPFGGFFASGFERGFKIKDFGDSIPGHGGMTDRMDCQVSHCPNLLFALVCPDAGAPHAPEHCNPASHSRL